MKKTFLKAGKTLVSVFVFLIVLELLLRLTGIMLTYDEQYSNEYNYKYRRNNGSWFHTWQPNTVVDYVSGEFSTVNYYNDLGHREMDFSVFLKDTTTTKYVFLGDSFTEGDGAVKDSTWIKSFETNAQASSNENFLCYNAGVCGSDVYFNYIMLKEKLLASKPKAVFECVNNSDIHDIYYLGDLDRFQEDGTLKSPNEPGWEPLFKYSHVFRLFIRVFTPYNHSLIKSSTWEEDQKKVVQKIAEQIITTNELCVNNNIEYYLVYMPVPDDISYIETSYFDSLLKYVPKSINTLNIYPCMFATFDSLDITSYSWERNGHYNNEGYRLMGNCVYDEFQKIKSLE